MNRDRITVAGNRSGPGIHEGHGDKGSRQQGMIRILARLAAAGLLGFVLMPPAQASEALQPRELKTLFPGTFHAVIHGQDVTFLARRNGSLLARSGESTDTGEWSIRQDELCIMLTSWLGGRTECGQVIEHGDWYRVSYILFRKP
jgi:hypothetical protein